MPETMPVQQQSPDNGKQNPWDMNVGDLHDTIANNELPAPRGHERWNGVFRWDEDPAKFAEAKAHAESGLVEDKDKALQMAYAAKTGIDSVLEVVEARDHDNPSTIISATLRNKDGSLFGGLVNPNGHGTQLVTKPRRVELVKDGVKTGKTGVRAETYDYAQLAHTIKAANKAANEAGIEYDKKKTT